MSNRNTPFRAHQWHGAPSVSTGPAWMSVTRPKLAAYRCSVCGKHIVGKRPSHTERCSGRFAHS